MNSVANKDFRRRYFVDFSRYVNHYWDGDPMLVGQYSELWRAVDKTNGFQVAIILSHMGIGAKDKKNFIRNLKVLGTNNHPATLSLIGYGHVNYDPSNLFTVVPPFFFNLFDALQPSPSGVEVLTATRKSTILFGIVSGFADLHSRSVIHRDLQLRNIFLKSNFEPVIGGFDISRFVALTVNAIALHRHSFWPLRFINVITTTLRLMFLHLLSSCIYCSHHSQNVMTDYPATKI
jgi:serine/threonine protein kinase